MTERPQGAEMGAGARATHPSAGGPRGARWRATSCGWGNGEGSARVRLRARAGMFCRAKQRMCSESERVRFLARVGVCKRREEKCSLLCQRALTRKRTLLGGGALERSHSTPLEPLAQLGDAVGGVGALDIAIGWRIFILIQVETTEPVARQAAKRRRSVNGC